MFRSPENICNGTFYKNSEQRYIKPLIILSKKKLIWGAQGSSLGPECISAGMKTQLLNLKWGYLRCNKQKGIILINFLHLKFRGVNYPSISESLKLSKVSAWCRYQECLFRKYYPQIIIEVSVTDVFLTNFHLLNIFF